jgi:CO/xanthine dehydrogenase FAD-binding subunit
MKPAPFEYSAPTSVAEAIELLTAGGDDDEIKLLAGGQSLMPLLNMRLSRPTRLVDLAKVEGLDFIRETDGGLVIGAMTTKRSVEDCEAIKRDHPLFWESTIAIGHPQIRNRGTVGGSMAQADPAAEYPAVALALDMEMVAQGTGGERVIPAADFFITYLTTDLGPDEILTEVRVPRLPAGTGWSFQELARRHGDFAMVGAVVRLRIADGRCADSRIVLFGVADRAVRMAGAEAQLDGSEPTAELLEQVGAKVAEEIEDPVSDVHASGDYRRHLANVLTRRGIEEAVGRAG